MSLIKKTIVLTKDKAVGYVTLVRVGSNSGAKLVLTEKFDENELYLVIKVSQLPVFLAKVEGERSEYNQAVDFESSDLIGVALVDSEGKMIASGGRKDIINLDSVKEVLKSSNTEEPVSKESPKEEISESKRAVEDKGTLKKSPKETYVTNVKKESGKSPKEPVEKQASSAQEKEDIVISPPEEKPRKTMKFPKGENFYQSVRGKIDELITINPRESRLEKAIPDSKFVKVNYDGDDYYVVGVLSESGITTHIVYGVPGRKEVRPPREAEALCDFLPLDEKSGYWLMFQDAQSGEISQTEEM